jgi:hypothetical protein
MKKSRFTDEQIVAILYEWDAGGKLVDLVGRHHVTEQTLLSLEKEVRWPPGE